MTERYPPEVIRRLREEARERFRAYAQGVLLPALGVAGPVEVSVPERGLGSLLYFVSAPGAPPLVLRGERRRSGLRRRIEAHALLRRHDIPAPAIVHRDLSLWTRVRWGFYFAAEERLAGAPLQDHAEPLRAAPAAGRLFARLHSVVNERAGLLSEASGSLERPLRRKAEEWLARYRRGGCPEPERVRQWVAGWPAACWRHARRLCMGDIAANNVLVQDDEAALIDLAGAGFGSAPFELARLRHKLLADRDEAWEAFLPAYLEAAAPALRAEVERAFPLWEGLQRLRLAGRYRGARREPHLERLLKLIGTAPSAPP